MKSTFPFLRQAAEAQQEATSSKTQEQDATFDETLGKAKFPLSGRFPECSRCPAGISLEHSQRKNGRKWGQIFILDFVFFFC